MAPDLTSLLAVGGDINGGGILSQKVRISGPDNSIGLVNGALNGIFGIPSCNSGHGMINEGDASATHKDFYLNGDNISFQPTLFQQLHQPALDTGNGTYSIDAIKEHFARRYAASKAANKQFYFNVPSAAIVMGAYYFIPGFMSNGTLGAGGIAIEASVTAFYGARPDRENAWDDPELTYTHVPERIPGAGRYRRRTPMTLVEAVGGILDVYMYALPPLGGGGADDSFALGPLDLPTSVQGFSCFLYNAVYANFPAELFNVVDALADIVILISSTLAPGGFALGCEVNFSDANGTDVTSVDWSSWSEKHVGRVKDNAVGSAWCKT
ncbi:hypothetical protein DBV05_g9662 [Lasiodiplodia theobromae]|uniref:Heme haloperoxidase family profile domain-containing protein n=1 Tax=Lasiodiplodia theobromae TaxID=45133 RepID=A0A5N5D1W9_9PEZI|nr:hypothetical protein DBV05_g9662 [Lasiodiplodia theobromae]